MENDLFKKLNLWKYPTSFLLKHSMYITFEKNSVNNCLELFFVFDLLLRTLTGTFYHTWIEKEFRLRYGTGIPFSFFNFKKKEYVFR